MQFRTKTAMVLLTAILLFAPITFVLLPASGVVQAAGKSRAPNVIATTLAFSNGQVVTVQYSNTYFCNSAGPATSSSSSPCVVGIDATKDPVPDNASAILDVIVPAFLPPLCGIVGVTCVSGAGLVSMGYTSGNGGGLGSGFSNTVLDSSLGANDLTQCPDNPVTLTCPNHPDFLDLTPTGLGLGIVPLPIHSHILSGFNGAGQGGWWKLRVWLVLDPTIWPNPNTGSCTAGSGCLTSLAALQGAGGSQVVGPVLTTIYLHFNIVSPSAK